MPRSRRQEYHTLGTITPLQVLVNDVPLFDHCTCLMERLTFPHLFWTNRLTFTVDRDAWSVLIPNVLCSASDDGTLTTWEFLFPDAPTIHWTAYLGGVAFRGLDTAIEVVVDLSVAQDEAGPTRA